MVRKKINNVKKKFLLKVIMISTISISTEAQNISVEGGMGFYTLYDHTFYSGELNINPTPVFSLDLTWSLSELFQISWENSFRLKSIKADYMGIDTVSLENGINSFREFNYFNIDSKVIGVLSLIKYDDGYFFAHFGCGISVPLSQESDYYIVDPRFILRQEYYIWDSDPVIILDGNILTEFGVGANFNKILLSVSFITELFKTNLYAVAYIRSSLLQINIGYNF